MRRVVLVGAPVPLATSVVVLQRPPPRSGHRKASSGSRIMYRFRAGPVSASGALPGREAFTTPWAGLYSSSAAPAADARKSPAMKMLLAAAVLLGALSSTEALAQEGDSGAGESRLGTVERRVDEAEDVIVEQVLALRRRVETLEERVRVLEAELTALRRSSP